MTRSELKEAVKEGVTEALDEHEWEQETEEEDETDTESSGGRPVGKVFVLLAAMAAFAFFARRRRGSGESEEY